MNYKNYFDDVCVLKQANDLLWDYWSTRRPSQTLENIKKFRVVLEILEIFLLSPDPSDTPKLYCYIYLLHKTPIEKILKKPHSLSGFQYLPIKNLCVKILEGWRWVHDIWIEMKTIEPEVCTKVEEACALGF